jgi:hypothetical protein
MGESGFMAAESRWKVSSQKVRGPAMSTPITPNLTRTKSKGFAEILFFGGRACDCRVPFLREKLSMRNRPLCQNSIVSGRRERSHVCENGSKLAKQ